MSLLIYIETVLSDKIVTHLDKSVNFGYQHVAISVYHLYNNNSRTIVSPPPLKNTVRLTLDRQEISSAISRNISIYIAESNHALLRPELLLPCGPRGMCQPSFACVSPACSVLFLPGRRVWSLPLYGSSIFLWAVPFRGPSSASSVSGYYFGLFGGCVAPAPRRCTAGPCCYGRQLPPVRHFSQLRRLWAPAFYY